jgi:hypothetical protein
MGSDDGDTRSSMFGISLYSCGPVIGMVEADIFLSRQRLKKVVLVVVKYSQVEGDRQRYWGRVMHNINLRSE